MPVPARRRLRPARSGAIIAGLTIALAASGCATQAPATRSPSPTQSFATLAGPRPIATDSLVGGYAIGIPAWLQELPPESTVLVTSAENDARDKVNVSVSFTCPAAPADVISYYDKLTTKHGFVGAAKPASTGEAQSVTYTKSATGEYITVAAVPGDAASAASVYGAVIPDLD